MNLERVVAAVSMVVMGGLSTLIGHSAVSACEPSGWFVEATPQLPCLALRQSQTMQDRFDVHNKCSAQVELTPEACDEPCADTLRIGPNNAAALTVPKNPRDGEQRIFEYKTSEQTGTIELTYDLIMCAGEGGCSVASIGDRSSAPSLVALSFILLASRFWRRRAAVKRRRAGDHWRKATIGCRRALRACAVRSR